MTFNSLWGNINTILMIGGAIMATIGLVRIFMRMNAGEGRHIENDIYLWLGGALVLLTAGFVSKTLFHV